MKRRSFLAAAVFSPLVLSPLAPVAKLYKFSELRVFINGVELKPISVTELTTSSRAFDLSYASTVEIECSNIVPIKRAKQ